ncbi:MAG TPA: hypothetical protein V6C81_01060 [Planktothrix sp.]
MVRHECDQSVPQHQLTEADMAVAIMQSEASMCRVNAPPHLVITGKIVPVQGDMKPPVISAPPPPPIEILPYVWTPEQAATACPPNTPSEVVTQQTTAENAAEVQPTKTETTAENAAKVQAGTTEVTPEDAAKVQTATVVAPEQAAKNIVVTPTVTPQEAVTQSQAQVTADNAAQTQAPAQGEGCYVQVSPVKPCDNPPPPFHDHFRGLNFLVFKIGVDDRGSFALGANVGLAKFDARVGRVTGIDAGAGLGKVIGAHGGAGVNFERDGVRGHVNAGAGVAEAIKGNFGFGAQLGPKTGFNSMVDAKVLAAHTKHGVSSYVGDEGFNTGYEGNVGVGKAVGAGVRGHIGFNDNSSVGGEAGVRAGSASIGTGVDVDTYGNTVIRPDVALLKAKSDNEEGSLHVIGQVGPAADVKAGISAQHRTYVDQQSYDDNSDVSFQVGQNGVGFKNVQSNDQMTDERGFGFGKAFDY